MEDIELIINITKHEWEYLNKLVENGDQLGHYERLLVNGIPLPKGHGRLIDADELELDADWNDYYDGYIAYSESMIKYAPTIIEADEEVE